MIGLLEGAPHIEDLRGLGKSPWWHLRRPKRTSSHHVNTAFSLRSPAVLTTKPVKLYECTAPAASVAIPSNDTELTVIVRETAAAKHPLDQQLQELLSLQEGGHVCQEVRGSRNQKLYDGY